MNKLFVAFLFCFIAISSVAHSQTQFGVDSDLNISSYGGNDAGYAFSQVVPVAGVFV